MSLRVFARHAVLLLGICTGCQPGASGASGTASSVSVAEEPPGATCPNGGKRITVQTGDAEPTSSFVCNGADGARGADGHAGTKGTDGAAGAAGAAASVDVSDAGPACPSGGKAIVTRVGNGSPVTSYVCNGADGQGVIVTAEPAGANCPAGGVRLQVGTLSPQYTCNGGAGDGVEWGAVSASTVARANHGYLATGLGEVAITLPASGGLSPGDVIDVTAAQAGGVAVVAGAGQRILFGGAVPALAGTLWTARPGVVNGANAAYADYAAYAMSADGKRVVAAVLNGQILVSADSGATWAARESVRSWAAVASSADGTRLVAAVSGGQIYTSSDSGATWTPRDTSRYWSSVASSADGSKLVATTGGTGSDLLRSSDYGATWAPTWPHNGNLNAVYDVALSAGGNTIVAQTSYYDQDIDMEIFELYTSPDFGATWTLRDSTRRWGSIVSSSDGTALAALSSGVLYTSTDRGSTWVSRETTGACGRASTVASSGDGTKLAVTTANALCTSSDGGATWTTRGAGAFSLVAASPNLDRLAAVKGNQLHTSDNRAGVRVNGRSGARIQLRYVGGGAFLVTDASGDVSGS